MYIFFIIFFSIMVYYRIMNVVPCVTQQDLVVYPFSIHSFATVNPKLPVLPFPTSSHLATTSLFSMSVSYIVFFPVPPTHWSCVCNICNHSQNTSSWASCRPCFLSCTHAKTFESAALFYKVATSCPRFITSALWGMVL